MADSDLMAPNALAASTWTPQKGVLQDSLPESLDAVRSVQLRQVLGRLYATDNVLVVL